MINGAIDPMVKLPRFTMVNLPHISSIYKSSLINL